MMEKKKNRVSSDRREFIKIAAKYWTGLMDASLKDLQTDYMDAYYLMAVDNPSLVRSEEVYNEYPKSEIWRTYFY